MDLGLNDKTALVTGASAGLGRAIAQHLAAQGVKLCIAARRRDLLDSLVTEIVAAGGPRPHAVTIDLMQEDAPQKIAGAALERLGRIDILIHCAGGSSKMSLDSPEEKWRDTVTMKYTRVRQLTLAVVPGMIQHRWGRVINIRGKSEPVELLSATPANGAWHAFAKALSREVGKHGVTINSIAPGLIMSEQIRRRHSDEYISQRASQEIPLGRYGEPAELACVATFIASPVASYITGAIIPVDGGLRRFAF
jgi:3-oxoacyl-[acyl-carrier protein] reductase